MLDEIGLFDEDFFAYCEDTDLGLRARIAGWRCRYVPGALVRHHYSGSTAPHSPFKAFHVERNRIWVVVKCFPAGHGGHEPRSTPWRATRCSSIPRSSAEGPRPSWPRTQSPWALAGIVVRAWVAALVRLPEMWRRRRAIHSTSKISRRELARLLRAHRVGLSELALKD